MQEIERKFIIPNSSYEAGNLKKFLTCNDVMEIFQGYISIGDPEIRVRRCTRLCGDFEGLKEYTLGIKMGSGLVRQEFKMELSEGQYHELFDSTTSHITKTRYVFEEEGFDIEVDVFRGSHSRLTLAEIEFSSVEESENYVPPLWFGTEVTTDKRYKNKYLSTHHEF